MYSFSPSSSLDWHNAALLAENQQELVTMVLPPGNPDLHTTSTQAPHYMTRISPLKHRTPLIVLLNASSTCISKRRDKKGEGEGRDAKRQTKECTKLPPATMLLLVE